MIGMTTAINVVLYNDGHTAILACRYISSGKSMSNPPADEPVSAVAATMSNTALPTASSADPAASWVRREPFSFTGTGREYFGIWIVNVLLTILTLGIYSAWAKVRSTRYFYDNTTVAGAGFDYHGDPVAILKGRIIAVAMVLAYNFSFKISLLLGICTLAVILLVMPWLVWKSLQFKLHNSSYRGIRFSFQASLKGAYETYLKMPLIAVLTLGFGLPFVQQRINRFQHEESRFGDTPFRLTASVKQFYQVYGFALMLGVTAVIAIAILGFIGSVGSWVFLKASAAARTPGKLWMAVPILFILTIYLMTFVVAAVFRCLMQNLIWSHTRLGGHVFECGLQSHRLVWIYLGNLVGLLCTLGLYAPYAKIRILKYRIESMALITHGSIDDVVAQAQSPTSAVGEGAADLMGFDIGL
jgi:uncharacterized membrane protein YjgN (DUF898 family)